MTETFLLKLEKPNPKIDEKLKSKTCFLKNCVRFCTVLSAFRFEICNVHSTLPTLHLRIYCRLLDICEDLHSCLYTVEILIDGVWPRVGSPGNPNQLVTTRICRNVNKIVFLSEALSQSLFTETKNFFLLLLTSFYAKNLKGSAHAYCTWWKPLKIWKITLVGVAVPMSVRLHIIFEHGRNWTRKQITQIDRETCRT